MTHAYPRPWLLVFVLTIAYAVSFLDRYLLNLLVEPIKHAFGLSDIRVSLLQGFAFSIFLVVSGLPLGWLIDHSRRLTILAVGIGLWSLATMGCGLATGYAGLFVCRIGVAVGEATLLPAAASLLVDAVPKKRLGLAFGVFSAGVNIGIGLAFLLGATVIARLSGTPALALPLVGTIAPWQGAFIAVGAPGLLLAVWIMTLREPARQATRDTPDTREATLAFFRTHARSLAGLLLCGAFAAMSIQAVAAWMPTLLIRVYGFSLPRAGTAYGLITITCGLAGVVLGGLVGDALATRGFSDGRLRAILASVLVGAPFTVAAALAGTPAATITLLIPAQLFGTMFIGNFGAALQEILPSRIQGLTAAIAVLVSNLIGLGLGPTAVALLTDLVFRDELQLPKALAAVSLTALCLSLVFGTLALSPYRRSRAALAPG